MNTTKAPNQIDGEVISSVTEMELTPAYHETVRRSGIDPRRLFEPSGAGECPCGWGGHGIYSI